MDDAIAVVLFVGGGRIKVCKSIDSPCFEVARGEKMRALHKLGRKLETVTLTD